MAAAATTTSYVGEEFEHVLGRLSIIFEQR